MLFFIIDLYTEKKSQAGQNVTLPPATVGGNVAAGGNVTLRPPAAHYSLLAMCHSSGLTKMAPPPSPSLPSGSQYIQHMYRQIW